MVLGSNLQGATKQDPWTPGDDGLKYEEMRLEDGARAWLMKGKSGHRAHKIFETELLFIFLFLIEASSKAWAFCLRRTIDDKPVFGKNLYQVF